MTAKKVVSFRDYNNIYTILAEDDNINMEDKDNNNKINIIQNGNNNSNNINEEYTILEECSIAVEKEEELAYVGELRIKKLLTIKMDSAASRSMAGSEGRLKNVTPLEGDSITITGFNGTISNVRLVGQNEDNKKEYYVPSMPENLVLLCANDYAQDGAVVLLPNSGMVIKMSENERKELLKTLNKYEVTKYLKVKNRTYEVDEWDDEFAYAAATQYFNTKIHTTSVDERILAHLISGFTLKDLKAAIKNKSVTGLHPEITSAALTRFGERWGSTPDAVQLAKPDLMGNKKGYMSEEEEILTIGQYVESDFMESDYNDEEKLSTSEEILDNGLKRKRIKKLPTHGGAIAAIVTVDSYSGFVMGRLVKSTAKSIELVKEIINEYEKHNYHIMEFAADNGILTQSTFRVITPEVETYLLGKRIATRRSEPYNHSNGTPTVEVTIRRIKNLIGMAVHYILRNPNFQYMGFTKNQILKLWGELFNWAITMINLKDCKSAPGKTKYEMFMKKKPNIQEIRILPIFAHLMVLRYHEGISSIDNTYGKYYQYGLYVGPDLKVKGAIRAAVLVNNSIQIIVTTKYKSVSDGGGLNPYPQVTAGLNRMLSDEVTETLENNTNDASKEYLSERSENLTNILPDTSEIESISEDESKISEQIKTNTNENNDDIPLVISQELKSDSSKNEDKNITIAKQSKKPKNTKAINRDNWPTREERIKMREERKQNLNETSFYADWNTNQNDSIYYSFLDNTYIKISSENENNNNLKNTDEDSNQIAYKAVTNNVPKTFTKALHDPVWGEPSRTEWNTLIETKALVEVDKHLAYKQISEGADLVILFPVYEEKLKDGALIKKVRLVGNGKTHYNAGDTYAPTPSKEELFVLLHHAAVNDWDYVHIDEKRAFLNSKYRGKNKVFTKLRGEDKIYSVEGALYGLRTSPRDYGKTVEDRLINMGFTRLHLCSCVYIKKYPETNNIIIIYQFVDDFVCFSSLTSLLEQFISEFRSLAPTTDPIWNATNVLGMTITRDRVRKIILIKLDTKIKELGENYKLNERKIRYQPMPRDGYLVNDYEFEDCTEEKKRFLNTEEKRNIHENCRIINLDNRGEKRHYIQCYVPFMVYKKSSDASFSDGLLCHDISILQH